MEPDNVHDKYDVKFLKNQAVVGHVPREISRYCSFVLNSGRTMNATVTGARENRRGNGLEVPCKYKLNGPKTFLSKADIISDIVSRRTNKFMKILLHHFFLKLKYALIYKPAGPIPRHKPMVLELVLPCLRGNMVFNKLAERY